VIRRVALVLTALLWTLPALAQVASGSIEGTIVNLKTGAPLRDADVALAGPYAERVIRPYEFTQRPARVHAVAGDQGRFVFQDLAAGNYLLRAARVGYRSGTYGESGVALELVQVEAGRQVKDLVVKLAPFGVIAGRVTDEAGVPLANARITVYTYAGGGWARVAQAGQPTQFGYTNDLGEYRAVLPAGSFIVSAAYPFAAARLGPDISPGVGHPAAYYPGSPGPGNAQVLGVVSGETVNADFTLGKSPAFRVGGYLAGPQGRVSGQACVGVVPQGSLPSGALMVGSISANLQDGSFTIVDVAPGTYVLTAGTCGNDPPVFGVQTLEVTGNVNDLKLNVTPAQDVRGTVKVEGKANLDGVVVTLLSGERFPAAAPRATVSGSKPLVFERALSLHYLPGFTGLPPDCFVRSVRYGGREVAATGFVPAPGASLEIIVSASRAAQLTGSVKDGASRPVPYPLATLIPSDGGPVVSARSVAGDADGNFVFPALRPGKYLAAAWDRIVDIYQLPWDSRTHKLYREKGTEVTVRAGKPPVVVLKLITAAEVARARSGL
jgi:hypothetical protein